MYYCEDCACEMEVDERGNCLACGCFIEKRKWIEERRLFRQWLADLNMSELLDIAEDIKLRLDYESVIQQQIQDAIELQRKAVS